jgi:hypothetical protein
MWLNDRARTQGPNHQQFILPLATSTWYSSRQRDWREDCRWRLCSYATTQLLGSTKLCRSTTSRNEWMQLIVGNYTVYLCGVWYNLIVAVKPRLAWMYTCCNSVCLCNLCIPIQPYLPVYLHHSNIDVALPSLCFLPSWVVVVLRKHFSQYSSSLAYH